MSKRAIITVVIAATLVLIAYTITYLPWHFVTNNN